MAHLRTTILTLSLILALPLTAATVTATIDSYHSASLEGDVAQMDVSFENDNHSGGQLTAGKAAVLTISNMPKCRVKSIVLSMKSNQSSGKGSAYVTVGSETIVIAENKPFSEWQSAGYSTVYVPVSVSGDWMVLQDESIVLRVSASENSLYLASMTIAYDLAAPEPYTLTLSYAGASGQTEETQLTESAVSSGIVLPMMEDASEDFAFVGWVSHEIPETTIAPTYYREGTLFYPQKNTTLYALYNDGKMLWVEQDTSLTSGEYMLVSTNYLDIESVATSYALKGGVVKASSSKNAVDMEECYVEKVDSLWHLRTKAVQKELRYRLTFEGDSLTLLNLYGEDNWVGYNASTLSSNNRPWKWSAHKDHSLLFYTPKDETRGYTIFPNILEEHMGQYTMLTVTIDYVYWLLFPVASLPEAEPTSRYTTSPNALTAVEEVSPNALKPRKYLRKGQLVIATPQNEYTILGTLITH